MSGQSGGGRAGIADDLMMRLIQIVVGLTCAFAFLAIALYRVPLDAVASSLARTSPFWLGAALAAYALDLALRTWRWRLILRPVARLRYLTVARVLIAGYGLNTIMPLRLGELFRAEFLKKTAYVPRVQALASIVVERLLDGLAVVFCLGLGLLFAARTRPPSPLLVDALAAGGAVFGLVLVVVLCLGGHRAAGLFARLPRLHGAVLAAREGLAILRTRRALRAAAMPARSSSRGVRPAIAATIAAAAAAAASARSPRVHRPRRRARPKWRCRSAAVAARRSGLRRSWVTLPVHPR